MQWNAENFDKPKDDFDKVQEKPPKKEKPPKLKPVEAATVKADSDKQIESWEREKEKLQEVCDDLHRQFIDLDMGGDAVVTKTKFKQVLVQYVA